MNDFITEREYVLEVGRQAVMLGYTPQQISMFIMDIKECYSENKSIEQCLDEVF